MKKLLFLLLLSVKCGAQQVDTTDFFILIPKGYVEYMANAFAHDSTKGFFFSKGHNASQFGKLKLDTMNFFYGDYYYKLTPIPIGKISDSAYNFSVKYDSMPASVHTFSIGN